MLITTFMHAAMQSKRPDETAVEFAGRVQKMIADTAKLRIVPWDGYLKYYNLGAKNPGEWVGTLGLGWDGGSQRGERREEDACML